MVSRKWFRSRAPWIAVTVLLVLALAGYLVWRRGAVEPVQVMFSDLLRDVDRGVVAEMVVDGDLLDVKTSDGRTFQALTPPAYVTANPSWCAISFAPCLNSAARSAASSASP